MLNILNIKNEFKSLIPVLTQVELEQLTERLKRDGCRDPICVWNGTIVDGHNRYDICNSNGIEFELHKMDFETENEAKLWIIKNQFSRRNLNLFKRIELSLLMKDILKQEEKENQLSGLKQNKTVCQNSDKRKKLDTKKELAELSGSSHDSVNRVKNIINKGIPKLVDRVRNEDISINLAYYISKLPEETQNQLVNRNEKEIRQEITKHKTKNKKDETKPEKNSERKDDNTEKDLPPDDENTEVEESVTIPEQTAKASIKTNNGKVYQLIYFDPYFTNKKLENTNNITEFADGDSVCLLWSKSQDLEKSLLFLKTNGFVYRNCVLWGKDKNFFQGKYVTEKHEMLLIGEKGNTKTPMDKFDSLISEKCTDTGNKPNIFYQKIDEIFHDFTKVELFVAKPTMKDGWEVING